MDVFGLDVFDGGYFEFSDIIHVEVPDVVQVVWGEQQVEIEEVVEVRLRKGSSGLLCDGVGSSYSCPRGFVIGFQESLEFPSGENSPIDANSGSQGVEVCIGDYPVLTHGHKKKVVIVDFDGCSMLMHGPVE